MSKKQLVPLSGALAVILFIASFVAAGDTPDAHASLTEVTSFYADHDTGAQVGAFLLTLGAFFYLIFTTMVAGLLRRAEAEITTPSVFALAGGIIFATGAAIFAGLSFSLGDAADHVGPDVLQALNVLSYDLFAPTILGLAAFMLGTAVVVLKHPGLMPRWLGWAAVVIGVVALTPAGFFGFVAFGIWTLIVSIMLAMRVDAQP